MAEVVSEFPVDGRGKYPWDEWLDGRSWKLTSGVDFDVSTHTFQSQAIMAGRRAGVKVRTRTKGDDVYVQASRQEGVK